MHLQEPDLGEGKRLGQENWAQESVLDEYMAGGEQSRIEVPCKRMLMEQIAHSPHTSRGYRCLGKETILFLGFLPVHMYSI